ncbi:PTS glucose transporter subunit IIA [Mediterraneibacter glycyrrhizinilyticus]|uniref:PTS beta-glucoside transporter subunit IIBCA n=1 Tax=Mediterraneibacter glycyrrhizinilyticus TaxID=342942 RepID=UPI000B36AC4C|nr:PTS beta-glucoside transporter subunit IIBCA [Mediterraneibacter glycyrrhizinilyticus]MCF2569992.1 PTS glucose transporter subunit IIA [Mediterraneibacter glycyrrhizinilyticus]OUO31492.1 PTS beta-glucoside transporter subunit EIIBCA [Lachnoclostridium sp. An298]
MDYRKTAQDILDKVGGGKNIVSAAHCATRLRLVIADNSKADKTAIENVEGVKGVFEASGQLQIILGTGTVNKVFDEFISIAGITASSKAEAKEAAAQKQNVFMRAIKLLGDIFVPIIPAIVASGFLMGIMNSLDFMINNGFINMDTSSSIYVFANLFSNTAYTFLQILIAFSAAKAFGANPYLGAVIGMIMINPSLQNAYTVATEGVQQTQSVFFGLYDIDMVGYQGHVIPVVIAVWLLSVIEKKLHKIVPEVLDLFVTPLVSVFVTGYLTLSIIGPVFVWAENAILGGIQWMLTLPLGIGSLIMGALYAPTVVTGIHQMYTAIDIGQIAQYGVTYWLPLASAANVAQGAAALAVALKSKDKKIKSLALPSSLSAFMGITEPAIFGVNLRFFKPFIAGCIGGGCGALYASIVHLGAKGTGVTGIFGILLCLEQPVQYLIEMVIAVGVAFTISFLIYRDAKPETAAGGTASGAAAGAAIADHAAEGASSVMEETDENDSVKAVPAEEEIKSPVKGKVIPLAEVTDETFASEMLGTTVAIEPEDGKIVAPCDAEVLNVFDTGHAVCLTTQSGGELLIHVGVDTVKMEGKGFTKKVSDGAKVHAGDVLIEADLDTIRAAGYPATTMVILTNADDFAEVTKAEPGPAAIDQTIMNLKK